MTHDVQLLRRYAEEGFEPAFSELVSLHVDLVYSVAVRLVGGDAHLAQDVTQTVFTDLSRKAGSLPRSVVLAGWLHRHTFFVASSLVRTEQRRRARERQAAQVNTPGNSTEPDWDRLSPFLDKALQELGTADRDAIVLRYYRGWDLKAVGTALGVNEDAAQKRVSRALDRLRSRFAKRGVTITVATLAATISSHAVTAAPAAMAGQVAASVFAGTGTASGAALTWVKFIAWLKTEAGAVSVITVLVATIATTWLLQTESRKLPMALGDETRTQAVEQEEIAGSAQNTPRTRFGFHWSQVESADYRQYIANLRAIGCPEQTVRDIIIADLSQLYATRKRAIWTPPALVYWRKARESRPNPEQIQRLEALDQELATISRQLLGSAVRMQDLLDLANFIVRDTESELLFLSAEQRETARRALQESGFEDRLLESQMTNRYSDQREMFDEKLNLLAAVLSPEEQEEFRLRNSPRARWLREDLQYVNYTPRELKALLDLREQHLGTNRMDHLTVDRATAIEQVRMILGDERAKEYVRVSDPGYLNARRAADRVGLPPEVADQVGQIARDARVAVERISTNTSFSVEERRRQVRTLQSWAEEQLNARIGTESVAAVHEALQFTLANTAQRIRP